MKRLFILLVVIMSGLSGCAYGGAKTENMDQAVTSVKESDSKGEESSQKSFEGIAKDTLSALKDKDYKKLATLINPEKGIVFSTTPYLVEGEYANLSVQQLEAYSEGENEEALVRWGIEGGSGDEIILSFKDFCDKYLSIEDYLGPDITVNYGDIQTVGSDTVNYKEKFPNATAVMYYDPGTKKNENMDWKAMLLVYEEQEEETYLVAVLLAKFTP